METTSLKALALKVLQGNRKGNLPETASETAETFGKRNCHEVSMTEEARCNLNLPVGNVAYRVYSEILKAHLWLVDADEDMKALRASEKVTVAIYTADEIQKLKGMDSEGLKAVHRFKEIFEDSKVAKVNLNRKEG